MLRRKLILALAPLILMVMALAVCSIVLIESAIENLSNLGEAVLNRSATSAAITSRLEEIESELLAVREEPSPANHQDSLASAMANLNEEIARHEHALRTQNGASAKFALADKQKDLSSQTARLFAAQTGDAKVAAAREVQRAAADMRQELAAMNRTTEADFEHERDRQATALRWWTLGLGLAFLAVINISIMVLIRAAGMILKPVNELVEASRHLAREEFDYRVRIDQQDEFGELAVATNSMARQLQSIEQRRLEVLQQVARTLNHELNNALSTIDLQLRLVARRGGSQDAENEQRLRQIHETLRRMSDTVASLTRIRKVVLTEYVGGIQMVDLQRSIEGDSGSPSHETPLPQAGAQVEAEPRP